MLKITTNWAQTLDSDFVVSLKIRRVMYKKWDPMNHSNIYRQRILSYGGEESQLSRSRKIIKVEVKVIL